jgi:hypothetical protein
MCSNGALQFSLWYGTAMQHWRHANCSVHVALLHHSNCALQFALCKLCYILLLGITGDFQFALRKLQVRVLHCSTDDQFRLCKLYWRQCNAAQVTCNLWCINCIMWYCSATVANFSFHCASYYMLVLHYRMGETEFALCKLYYVILQCSVSDL